MSQYVDVTQSVPFEWNNLSEACRRDANFSGVQLNNLEGGNDQIMRFEFIRKVGRKAIDFRLLSNFVKQILELDGNTVKYIFLKICKNRDSEKN